VTAAAGLRNLAARLERGSGPLLLTAADLQIPPAGLGELTDDPRPVTRALVSRATAADERPAGEGHRSGAVRRRGGLVVSAGSPVHEVSRADGVFVGALEVAQSDRPRAADAARAAADAADRHGWQGDPLDLLLVSMVRSGLAVTAVPADPWPWRRGAAGAARQETAAAQDALGADDVHRIRLARATKADDGLVATFVSRPVARRLTPLALRAGLTPNAITASSLLVGLVAAACFAVGDRWSLVLGAVLLQLSLVVDCVDGDVARYTRRFSATGAWLDASTDRLKEFACYGGLAWGAAGGDDAGPWLLAAAMLALQTSRHTVDYTFTAVKDDRESESAVLPLEQPADTAGVTGSAAAARAVEASERSNRRAGVRWAKKALHLGIGERWLVLSALAAAGRPVAALAVLLVLGLGSLAYTSAGRTLRSRSWPAVRPSQREREIVAAQADLVPLAAGLAARVAAGSSRFLWVRPAVLRLAEYVVVVAVVAAVHADAVDAAYALLLVVASHHYDDLYRVLNRLSPPPVPVVVAGLGAVGRIVVVAALAAVGGDLLEGGVWVLAALLGILYVVVEPVRVLREVRRSAAPAPEAHGG
jgi:hypothetical protein